jgi:hypothetical protein
MYVPPVVIVIGADGTAELSHYTAWIYILARLFFSFSYWLAVKGVRSLAWLIGMICCAIMYYVGDLDNDPSLGEPPQRRAARKYNMTGLFDPIDISTLRAPNRILDGASDERGRHALTVRWTRLAGELQPLSPNWNNSGFIGSGIVPTLASKANAYVITHV